VPDSAYALDLVPPDQVRPDACAGGPSAAEQGLPRSPCHLEGF
jgi:hypothetical protein